MAAANQNVVDELVVKLSLDTEPYRKAEVTVESETDRTFRKQQERARITDRTNKDQQRRLKDVAGGVKAFAGQVAAAVGIVTGLGVAMKAIALTGLLAFETGLRRQAVGTAMSNRQMQAWGATARRLGADAAAGAEAIAALARERQQFELTGNAPTMQALARMGVNVDKGRPLEDVLAQAQQVYRQAPAGQKQQYENTLAAQGVSADLILMIKSERDVREAFTQSFSQAAEENRKALDQLADSLESMKATAITISATLLEALQPAIEVGAQKLSEFATQLGEFSRDVQAAGGGVEGFQKALDDNIPTIGRLFEGFRQEGQLLSDVAAVITTRFRETGDALGMLWDRITGWLNTIRAPWGEKGLVDDLTERAQRRAGVRHGRTVVEELVVRNSEWWDRLVGHSRAAPEATAANPLGLPRSIAEDDAPAPRPTNPLGLPRSIAEDDAPVATRGNPYGLPQPVADDAGRPVAATRANPNPQGLPNPVSDVPRAPARAAGRIDAQRLMNQLITQYQLTVQEAAAVVANWQGESGLRADAFNPAGGGSGARGLAQWRGGRTAAFKKRYGVMPDQASIDQQVEFAMTDPYERTLLMKSLRTGNTAAEMGRGVSQYYEAHGNVREDARRGAAAQKLADTFGGRAGGSGTTVNIQNMEVKTDQPSAFVGGLQRLSDSQNYNSVVR